MGIRASGDEFFLVRIIIIRSKVIYIYNEQGG